MNGVPIYSDINVAKMGVNPAIPKKKSVTGGEVFQPSWAAAFTLAQLAPITSLDRKPPHIVGFPFSILKEFDSNCCDIDTPAGKKRVELTGLT